MVNSTRTSSAIAHFAPSLKSVSTATLRAAALPRGTVTPITSARATETHLMREDVESLCSHMLWLRAWWEAHGDGISAADRKAASNVHDHFIDGAIFARGIAKKAGLDMQEEYIKSYAWGRNAQSLRMVVRGAK